MANICPTCESDFNGHYLPLWGLRHVAQTCTHASLGLGLSLACETGRNYIQ